MKEGKENSMVLDDEQEETIESFLQWAYVGDYGKLASDASHYLMLHVRLYVFGDRFNIPQLQELALEKFKTTVKTAGYKGLADDGVPSALLVNIIEATLVAFNNLPFPLEGDMLLNFLACHAGWALYSWRKYEGFWELMKNEDFAKALVEKLTETDNPPWYNL